LKAIPKYQELMSYEQKAPRSHNRSWNKRTSSKHTKLDKD